MTNTIIIGIDISKHFADMCAISGTGEVLLESKIYYDLPGLQHLTEQPQAQLLTQVLVMYVLVISTSQVVLSQSEQPQLRLVT